MVKSISLLGSTGSIGTQTLDCARQYNIDVASLSANRDYKKLAEQIIEFEPEIACICQSEYLEPLKALLPANCPTEIVTGQEGMIKCATVSKADICVTAVVGASGIRPTYAAILAGKRIGLANKETLVAAGSIIMEAARLHNTEIIPVDSEHSAIFQCLMGENTKDISKLVLTASGGPFRGFTKEQLNNVTLEQALKHPNWSMGSKITIDSASMMNKGFEVIEAGHLFGVSVDDIEVLVHPQSIVHSMVKFTDGSIKAQLGVPDMHIPIQLALTYPDRMPTVSDYPDLTKGPLTFEHPDLDTFRCLDLAFKCYREGGTSCAILNAANEIAVSAFLHKEITFVGIPQVIEATLEHIPSVELTNLDTVETADRQAREYSARYIKEHF